MVFEQKTQIELGPYKWKNLHRRPIVRGIRNVAYWICEVTALPATEGGNLINVRNKAVSLLALAALLICASTAFAQAPSGPIPSSFFGMHVGDAMNWPTVSIGAMGKGTRVTWSYIEPIQGTRDWTRLDAHVDLAQAHGARYLQALGGCPCWAAPVSLQGQCTPDANGNLAFQGMVNNIQDWDNFVTAMVNRYKGKIDYELANEPDNYFTGTAANMVTLTTHAYNLIRSIDPAAIIVAPSYVNASNLDAYYAAGGVKTIDVNSLHGYPATNNDIAETIQGFLTLPFRTVFSKYGINNKPLWDTEGSWGNESAGAITDPDLQVAFVARDYLLHWSFGFSRFNWYLWEDASGGWGFLLNSSTNKLRPATTAYQQVYDWMVGATMTQPCSFNGTDGYHAVYTCDLTRSGGYQARVVWNTDGDSAYTAASPIPSVPGLARECK